ncbi:MAG: hypothetical protein II132_06440 [Desulfovibrio sp.]|nr:hypothetical protein [Desulfovibrio sp.]
MSTASFQLASLRLNMPLAQLASLFRPSLPVSGQLDNTAPASMGKMVFILFIPYSGTKQAHSACGEAASALPSGRASLAPGGGAGTVSIRVAGFSVAEGLVAESGLRLPGTLLIREGQGH